MMVIMEELPTMEELLRALREMFASEPKREPDAAPLLMPEDIRRAINE